MVMLDRKLTRDLLRLWAQVLAIAMVMACGVATIVIAVGASRSLEETRSAFYDRYRFGSVFVTATRAPAYLADRIAEIPGIAAVQPRISQPVLLDIEGMAEPATGIAVSLPDFSEPDVNRLYLRRGRLPEPGRADEIAVIETFAEAHGFQPGDRFKAIINGRSRLLDIVGVVLSPEYIYALGPGEMVPDPRRFGVLFMSHSVLADIADMNGAFNDLAATLQRDANSERIIDTIDGILKPYGATGAYSRKDQISHAFLDSELVQLRAMATVIPPIFLFVSAFLVNMILSRLIQLEREQIGLLKAVGYSDLSIAWHYAKLVIAISAIGLIIGAIAGTWMGQGLTRLYGQFFSFPFLIFRRSFDLYIIAGGITVLAALAGGAKAIWVTVALPPAVAMRPPAPPRYRSFFSGRLQKLNFFSQLTTMSLRHMIRWPVRSALTALGTSMSVGLLITAMFSFDSIDYMIDTIFFRADRQDASLSFTTARAPSSMQDVAALPGVLRAEPFRTTQVILRNGHRERRLAIAGVPDDADLSRILDLDLNPVPPPDAGLLISERVANLLHLKPGDSVEIELLESGRRVEYLPVSGVVRGMKSSGDPVEPGQTALGMATGGVPVTAIVQSYVGLAVYARNEVVDRLMADGTRYSGVRIAIDPARLNELYEAVKQTPGLASIALQRVSLGQFRKTIAQNITVMMTVYIGLAVIITFGVIYNSARIQLSERARELASLRVFGFTRAEVSRVLLVELAVIVAIAQPLGWLLGFGFSWSVIKGFESDLFRIPLILNPATFATASLIVIAAAIVSALIVRRRVDRLDLVRVLKTRE